jgi:poly(A) polymerase
VLAHPRFRAAYDFLLLRGEAGEVPKDLCEWWTAYQEEHVDQQAQQTPSTRPRRRRRNRSRRKPEGSST